MRTIRDMDFSNKKVIMRVDFNVPLDDSGNITSDNRIKETIPTIKYILDKNCKQLILMSHLGKPDGKIIPKLKMDNVAKRLAELLKIDVAKTDDCLNANTNERVVLLENLRFHAEEEANNEEFARKLSAMADIYVNDAFGTMHRAHASTAGITKFIPGCIGFLVEKELKYLNVENLQKPIVTVLGGAKISTKLPLIQEFLIKADTVLLGGAMIFTFYKAKGWEIGKSLYEEHQIMLAKLMLNNEKLILPKDIVIADSISENAKTEMILADCIPDNMIGLDIGTRSIESFKIMLDNAKTIIWNGPLGYFEIKPFDKSTNEIAEYIAELTSKGAISILGGGDTEDAVSKIGLKDKFTHVSTGGGASLELLSGKELPAIKALEENEVEFHELR